MIRVDVTVKCRTHGTHAIIGKLVAPGLAVVERPHSKRPCFSVVHVRSGLVVLHASNVEAAAAAALALDDGETDWTVSATEIDGQPGGVAAQRRIVKKLSSAGVYGHRNGRVGFDMGDVVPR